MIFSNRSKKQGLFGGSVEPDCSYCSNHTGEDGAAGCRFHLTLEPGGSCRKFTYDPLLRTPEAPAGFSGGSFDPDDFAL